MSTDPLRDMEDRMAALASRIHHPDPAERRYASCWLHKLWTLHEAARRPTA